MARREAKEQIDMVTTQKYTDDELAYLPATEQIRLFKAGTITPTDVLEGVTVGVKNDHDVRGWRHDDGSLLADALGISAPGEEDDDIAERLRAAGRSDRSSTIPPKMRFEGVVIKFR